MTIAKLLTARQVFEGVSQTKLSVKLSWKIAMFLSKTKDNQDFYSKKIAEIINTYGEKDENNELVRADGGYKINADNKDACLKETTELQDVDVDIPDINFTLDELEGLTLSPADMMAIADFIAEE